MAFHLLQSGESIDFDTKSFPELPESSNYHTRENPLYKQYRSAQRARYSKAVHGAIRESIDSSDFTQRIQEAQMLLRDRNAWKEYLSNRGVTQLRPLLGRPKAKGSRVKRSDKMKVLLSKHNVEVNEEGKLFLNNKVFEGFLFLPNGRIRFLGNEKFNIEPYTLSAHQFISDYF
ncbi:MAG TPA: hypothetical protein EYP60_09765 [bacterium (Candidatus Stahlbacteria)]|nr:hypothetical protein [Candidatus Stahlbacteria bacterium]